MILLTISMTNHRKGRIIMKDFYHSEWNLPEKLLVTATALFFGIIVGFLFAPIKKGVYCGNHNGNTLPDKADE